MKKILFVMMSVLMGANTFAASTLSSGASKNTSLQLGRSGALKLTQKNSNSKNTNVRVALPLNFMVSGKKMSISSSNKPANIYNVADPEPYQLSFEQDDEAVYWTLSDNKGFETAPQQLFKFSDLAQQNTNTAIPQFMCEDGKIYYTYYGKWVLLKDSSCVAQNVGGFIPEFKCNYETGNLFYINSNGDDVVVPGTECIGENGKNAPLPMFKCDKEENLSYSVDAENWKQLAGTNLCSRKSVENTVQYRIDNVFCKNSRIQIGATVTDIECKEAESTYYEDLYCNKQTGTIWIKGKNSGTSCYDATLSCYDAIGEPNHILINGHKKTDVYDCEKMYCDGKYYVINDKTTYIPCDSTDLCDKHGILTGTDMACSPNQKVQCIDGWVCVDDVKLDVSCKALAVAYCDWNSGKAVLGGHMSSSISQCDDVAFGCWNNGNIAFAQGSSFSEVWGKCKTDVSVDATGNAVLSGLYTGLAYNTLNCQKNKSGTYDCIYSKTNDIYMFEDPNLKDYYSSLSEDECKTRCMPYEFL